MQNQGTGRTGLSRQMISILHRTITKCFGHRCHLVIMQIVLCRTRVEMISSRFCGITLPNQLYLRFDGRFVRIFVLNDYMIHDTPLLLVFFGGGVRIISYPVLQKQDS
jgi:hypothetical protein